MILLTYPQMKEYFHRSFTAADGLWFMKAEERYGFDTALDIDNDVWTIMPKIQVRMLKEMGKLGNSLDDLRECLETKLDLENFRFRVEEEHGEAFRIIITDCPWHNIMKKAGREDLSGKVGEKVCTTEFKAWAAEFDSSIKSSIKSQVCTGGLSCILEFRIEAESEDVGDDAE